MWCHGSAGIGMSRVMMSDYSNTSELMHEIDVAIKLYLSIEMLTRHKKMDLVVITVYAMAI
jgi:lantibiotic modifying enzyme